MQAHAPLRQAPSRDELAVAAWTALAFFIVSLGTTLLAWQPNNISGLRLGGAFLLGMMVRRQVDAVAAVLYLVLGYVALVLAMHLGGRPLPAALLIAIPRLLELALAYGLLRWMNVNTTTLQDFSKIARLVLVTVFLAPAFGASVGAWVTHWMLGASYVDGLIAWWIGNGFGMIVLLPLVLAVSQERVEALRSPDRRSALFWITLLTLAVSIGGVLWTTRPFVLVMLPLLYAAFRLGVLGTAAECLLASLTVVVLHRYLFLHASIGYAHAATLSFAEVAFYSSLTVIAPLLVSVLKEKRAAARKALNLAREQLQTVIDNVPALIGHLDTGRHYTLVNREYAQWFGRPVEDFIGRTSAEMVGEANADLLSGPASRALSGETVRFEMTIAGREASIVFVPQLRSGEVCGYFVLAHDISERKAAERALFAEKERIQVTLDSIGDAVVVCDRDLRVTLLNPVAEVMTGWSEREATGRFVDEVIQLVDMAHGETPLSPLRIEILDNRIV
jgi:PAS domain S-box-containing protein